MRLLLTYRSSVLASCTSLLTPSFSLLTSCFSLLPTPHFSPPPQGFCVFCTYYVVVAAAGACSFTLSATSSDALFVLEDGTPATEHVNKDAYE